MKVDPKLSEKMLIEHYKGYSLSELEAEKKKAQEVVAKARLHIYVLERMIRAQKKVIDSLDLDNLSGELDDMLKPNQPDIQGEVTIVQL